ncbi:hypothetical protein TBLA_0H01800 [Henningerozyma blattae CBS 6284]|uniref:Uncharacterized protein n=1 Tax=Henningerozyma blattae (strain ATCC 34711 / CBS 6284 / DSM 70876 / NBRC 10599 / NRRL Y-10934 / UCD 77-7) TaxID=1071380 RepID=I2H7W5_HENB6|nr:hypothetical protein TBLA_0H01800 [Tetrapisispora blattae CBS 6284]CCH62467.1 hypothetical protein TBLA_0H01800 [Tetrapisispora blattae CBS 6284]
MEIIWMIAQISTIFNNLNNIGGTISCKDYNTINTIKKSLNSIDNLRFFLHTASVNWKKNQLIRRYYLNDDQGFISCIYWKGIYYITGTDLVKCCMYRMQIFGRNIIQKKKFEEGIFSDLRSLKIGVDATLEQPRSEFLNFLFKNTCLKTQKKQKVFYWFAVLHDKLFSDALERDLKRENLNQLATTEAVNEPALSFKFDNSLNLTFNDQLNYFEIYLRRLASSIILDTIVKPNDNDNTNTNQNNGPSTSGIHYPLIGDIFDSGVETYMDKDFYSNYINSNNSRSISSFGYVNTSNATTILSAGTTNSEIPTNVYKTSVANKIVSNLPYTTQFYNTQVPVPHQINKTNIERDMKEASSMQYCVTQFEQSASIISQHNMHCMKKWVSRDAQSNISMKNIPQENYPDEFDSQSNTPISDFNSSLISPPPPPASHTNYNERKNHYSPINGEHPYPDHLPIQNYNNHSSPHLIQSQLLGSQVSETLNSSSPISATWLYSNPVSSIEHPTSTCHLQNSSNNLSHSSIYSQHFSNANSIHHTTPQANSHIYNPHYYPQINHSTTEMTHHQSARSPTTASSLNPIDDHMYSTPPWLLIPSEAMQPETPYPKKPSSSTSPDSSSKSNDHTSNDMDITT